MWLWRRPGAAALIQPLAQELYAAGVAIKEEKIGEYTLWIFVFS